MKTWCRVSAMAGSLSALLSLGRAVLAAETEKPPGPNTVPAAQGGPDAVLPPSISVPATVVPAPPPTPAPAPAAPAPAAAAAPQPEPSAKTAEETGEESSPSGGDIETRPYFIKGDLSSFAVRPLTRRNFVGVGAGIAALPNDPNTVFNSFFLTIEPQIDSSSPKFGWRLGLGAPLQFELLDTRGAFEVCVAAGREAKAMAGSDEFSVAGATATCITKQKDRALQNLGKLRRADWDRASDFARIVRYAVIGRQEEPFYVNLSRMYDETMGHGTVIRQYNPNIDYNTARLGAVVDVSKSALGLQMVANDLVRPDVLGGVVFLRPFRPFTENVFLRSLSLGASYASGVNQPRTLLYERGLFFPSYDQPIPRVGEALNLVGGQFEQVTIVGGDIEAKLIRTQEADLKVYADYQKMKNHGGGATLGTLWRFSYGQPTWRALRARAELTYFDADYLPNFFDGFHDIFQYQYLPMSYVASNNLTYYPTKMQYLAASHGGRKRLGQYVELTHSFLNYMTLGVSYRHWAPVGNPSTPGFTGPSFPDLGKNCTEDPVHPGELMCPTNITLPAEKGFTSLKLRGEFPFRRFLQAFASYEVFSTNAEGGLGVFKFNGDNEVFFSGARLMLLPILFIQAEARRYFFLQRISDVDVENGTLQQDQTYHSNWTFAVNIFLGYEF